MIKTLFTIGYAGRSSDELVALLEQHRITAVCDVRSLPYSRRHPQFNRETLLQTLRSHAIDYVFLGEELGARSKDPVSAIHGKTGFQRIATTPSFKNGLNRIKLGMQKGYVLALLCAEKDPMTCHRTLLICRSLRDQDLEIRHIIDQGDTETQAELEKRLIAHLRLHPDMFEDADPADLVERAYDVQSDRIA